MADLPNRAELEAELARRLAKVFGAHRRELMDLLGDPPNFSNIPSEFWQRLSNELTSTIIPLLSRVYMDMAEGMLEGLPFGIDWALINQRAAGWARSYTYDLIRGLTETTQRAVRDSVGSFFEQQLTRGDLEDMLARTFGANRASTIAVTEVTRAASEGQQELAREIADMGVKMTPVWNTRDDELVCPICGPLNGEEITTDEYPPAHPNCRCWVTYELPK